MGASVPRRQLDAPGEPEAQVAGHPLGSGSSGTEAQPCPPDFSPRCLLDTEDGDSGELPVFLKQPSTVAKWPGCGMALTCDFRGHVSF